MTLGSEYRYREPLGMTTVALHSLSLGSVQEYIFTIAPVVLPVLALPTLAAAAGRE